MIQTWMLRIKEIQAEFNELVYFCSVPWIPKPTQVERRTPTKEKEGWGSADLEQSDQKPK
jgi:hypothetical protein